MKVFMIGESGKHRDTLARHLTADAELVLLPREAAVSNSFDDQISADDVLISLRWARKASNSPLFKMLHVPGAGLDGIDLSSIPKTAWVCNVFEHEIPIAEYVMGAMIDLEIGYARMCADFTDEQWPALYRSRIPHGEIHGKTIALIGYGHIGQEIAKRAKAFGMVVRVTGRHTPTRGLEHMDAFHPIQDLASVLAKSDYVVIACPLSDSTRGLIDHHALSTMQDHATLINVSRAEIVDQKALYEALTQRQIGGAVLDVWWHYPLSEQDNPQPADYPFASLPNVRCTPHSSAWTRHLAERRYRVIARNIDNLTNGIPLVNVIHTP